MEMVLGVFIALELISSAWIGYYIMTISFICSPTTQKPVSAVLARAVYKASVSRSQWFHAAEEEISKLFTASLETVCAWSAVSMRMLQQLGSFPFYLNVDWDSIERSIRGVTDYLSFDI